MNRRTYTLLLACFFSIAFSCKKDKNSNEEMFYGQWQTSYGEVISFESRNGKHIVTSAQTAVSSSPAIQTREYRYVRGKLELSLDPFSSDYQTLQSFSWVTKGKEFTLRGYEWHPFLSSTLTTYTFKKL